MEERVYWAGFAAFPGIGPGRFGDLLQTCGSAEKAWVASEKTLQATIGRSLTEKFLHFRSTFSLQEYVQELQKLTISFVTFSEKEYPPSLKEIEKPPFVLFYKGDSSLLDASYRNVAVVGTRMVTEYGREVTRLFTDSLTGAGFTIVSGLALGVDAVAHMTALDTQGKTIAVLGCGIECCYPASNTSLYREILRSGGLIVSEYTLKMSPSRGSFPARNRIIAGLSEAILVTEGGEDSGSIITAMEGLKIGRKIFAVPGPITSRLSQGPYKMIGQGAKLVTSGNEMLKELGLKGLGHPRLSSGRPKGETKEEQVIIAILENESLHFDEIGKKVKIDTVVLGSLLSMMEVKGLIRQTAQGFYTVAT